MSILAAVAAEVLTVYRDYPTTSPPFHMTPESIISVPMILWVGVGIVFISSVLAIVHQELGRIAVSKGYTDPVPLTR